MKQSILISSFLFANLVFGQHSIDKYSPKYSSITACNIIQNSLDGRETGPIDTETFDTDAFLEDWQKSYSDLENGLRNWSLVYNTGAGLAKVAKDGIIDIATENPFVKYNPKTALITPFAKSLANRVGETVIDYIRDEAIESKTEEFEENVKRTIDQILVAKKYDQSTLPVTTIEIKKAYAIATKSDVELENYAVFNKIMLEKAFEYIDANNELIIQNIERLNGIDLQIGQLQEDFIGLSGQVFQNKESINQNKSAIDKLRTELKKEIDAKFAELNGSLSEIAKNQEKNLETINGFGKRIEANSERIKQIQTELGDVNISIEEIDKKVNEHDILIKQNQFYLEVIGGYTYQSLSLEDKIEALENNAFPWMDKVQINEKAEMLSELKDLSARKDFVQMASAVQSISNDAYKTLISNGFLKGKDAERVGKFMTYLNAGINISMAIATPNPASISNALFSTISLFGGNDSGPSPEMQMLQMIYDRMVQEFEVVNMKLDLIDQKLDTLISLNIQIHSDIMNALERNAEYNKMRFDGVISELNNIKDQLSEIDDISKLNVAISNRILRTEIDRCRGTIATLDELQDYQKFDNLNELNNFFTSTASCADCIKGLMRTADRLDKTFFLIPADDGFEGVEKLSYQIKPAFELYTELYGSNSTTVRISNSLPIKSLKQRNHYLTLLIDSQSDFGVEREIKNQLKDLVKWHQYIHPQSLIEFADWYLKLVIPYYDFLNTSIDPSNPILYNKEDYLETSEAIRQIKQTNIQQHIKFLIQVVDQAIIQQTILSGQHLVDKIYQIIYDGRYPGLREKAIRTLQNNPIIAFNFAKYAIGKNIDLPIKDLSENNYLEAFLNKADVLKNGSEKTEAEISTLIDALNGVAIYKPLQFIYVQELNTIYFNPKVEIPIIGTDQLETKSAYIQLPSKYDLVKHEMLFSKDLYKLSSLRNELLSTYLDISILKNIGQIEGITPVTYKNLLLEGLIILETSP